MLRDVRPVGIACMEKAHVGFVSLSSIHGAWRDGRLGDSSPGGGPAMQERERVGAAGAR